MHDIQTTTTLVCHIRGSILVDGYFKRFSFPPNAAFNPKQITHPWIYFILHSYQWHIRITSDRRLLIRSIWCSIEWAIGILIIFNHIDVRRLQNSRIAPSGTSAILIQKLKSVNQLSARPSSCETFTCLTYCTPSLNNELIVWKICCFNNMTYVFLNKIHF